MDISIIDMLKASFKEIGMQIKLSRVYDIYIKHDQDFERIKEGSRVYIHPGFYTQHTLSLKEVSICCFGYIDKLVINDLVITNFKGDIMYSNKVYTSNSIFCKNIELTRGFLLVDKLICEQTINNVNIVSTIRLINNTLTKGAT